MGTDSNQQNGNGKPVLTVITRLSGLRLAGLVLLPVVLWLLWKLWVVIALLLLAIIVATGLAPAVSWLERRGLSRFSATTGLYMLILAGLAGLGYAVGRILLQQFESFITTLPEYLARQSFVEPQLFLSGLGLTPERVPDLSLRVANYAGLAIQGVFAILLILLLSYYFVVDSLHLWRWGIRLVPDSYRAMTWALGHEIGRRLRGYLRGVMLSGLIVGLATGVGLALFDIPYALLFGLLAGILEGIPFLGPILAAFGPLVLALTHSPGRALAVAAFFIALQQIEDKVLVPRLQSHTTGLHPLVVITATLILGSLFGLFGLLLAVPLAAAGKALAVCVVSCFYHPEGTDAWMAERAPTHSTERDRRSSTVPPVVPGGHSN